MHALQHCLKSVPGANQYYSTCTKELASSKASRLCVMNVYVYMVDVDSQKDANGFALYCMVLYPCL